MSRHTKYVCRNAKPVAVLARPSALSTASLACGVVAVAIGALPCVRGWGGEWIATLANRLSPDQHNGLRSAGLGCIYLIPYLTGLACGTAACVCSVIARLGHCGSWRDAGDETSWRAKIGLVCGVMACWLLARR